MRSKPHPCARVFVALLVVAVAAGTATAGDRIVAVGDVHGSIDGLLEILRTAHLVDSEGHWAGGTDTFVQTGDVLDRGIHVRKAMDLLMRLQDEAEATGGRVVVLLGNHETMNLLGIYRDVNPGVFEEFTDGKSGRRRKEGYRDFVAYWRARAEAAGAGPALFTDEIKEEWMSLHPPGWLEYDEAIGPDGIYGRWLRHLPIVVKIDDVLFIHGGVGPALRGLSVSEINGRVRGELATYDRIRQYMIDHLYAAPTAGYHELAAEFARMEKPVPLLAPLANSSEWFLLWGEGPVWFRGAAKWDEAEHADMMAELLSEIGASYMVVGHTPQAKGRIHSRFGGRVFLIDTGMLRSHYHGRPAALVIDDGVFTALYQGESEVLEVAEPVPAAARHGELGDPLEVAVAAESPR